MNEMEQPSAKLSYWESRLLSLLEEEGCPICREISDTDRYYFFWFYNEKYCQPETVDALTRSLGFCAAHATQLTQRTEGSYQLSVVHEALTRRVLRALYEAGSFSSRRKQSPDLRIAGDCPPCRERGQRAGRDAFWLARLLEDESCFGRYGRPGMLCFPHLQVFVPHASGSTLQRLLDLHEAAMASCVKSLQDQRDRISRASLADCRELPEPLRRALWLAVGQERNPTRWPLPGKAIHPSGMRDPVKGFLEEIRRGEACPVCLEVHRAWREWTGWLNNTVPEGAVVQDLLPTCPEHVWPTVRHGRGPLVVGTVENVLTMALHQLRTALRAFAPPDKPAHPGPFSRGRLNLVGKWRHRLQAAREAMTRGLHCPVCNRLDEARDRALRLLFALIRDRGHQAAIRGGHGLCLKHLSRAFALKPPPPIREFLLEVEAAKLESLHWELEEALRKASWSTRPETRGTEGTSWRRAVRKFSGCFLEDGKRWLPAPHREEDSAINTTWFWEKGQND